MKKYCVLYPSIFAEYIMLLNLLTHFNHGNNKNLIIYSNKDDDDTNNIFNINNFKKY